MVSFSALRKKILVLDNFRQTLTVIRSLGRAGYHIILGIRKKTDFTAYSRYVAETWTHPDMKDAGAFLVALREFLAGHPDVTLLFPVGETSEQLCTRPDAKLPKSVTVVAPPSDLLESCLYKPLINCYTASLNIPVADSAKVSNLSDLHREIARIGYPCIVKPTVSTSAFFEKKAVILTRPEEVSQRIPYWPELPELLVQRMVIGPRRNCVCVAHQGKLYGYLEIEIVRVNTPDSTGNGVDFISVEPSETRRKYCQLLLEKLNYSGVATLQFILDKTTGVSSFLEINPRLGAGCAFSYYLGYDLPRLFVEVAESPDKVPVTLSSIPKTFTMGKHGVWLFGDFYGILSALKLREIDSTRALIWLGRSMKSLMHADCHLTWSWSDPLPTLILTKEFLFGFVKVSKAVLRNCIGH